MFISLEAGLFLLWEPEVEGQTMSEIKVGSQVQDGVRGALSPARSAHPLLSFLPREFQSHSL